MTTAEDEREEGLPHGKTYPIEGLLDPLKKLVRWFLSFFVILTCFASCSDAIEDICNGGASPRGDVECIDFDSLSNCTTGLENTCWTDNGFAATPGVEDYLWKITTCPVSAALGNGCSYARHTAGGTGSAVGKTISPTLTTLCQGSMVMFKNGFLQSSLINGHHGPSINFSDGSSCGGIISFDWWFRVPRISVAITGSTCGGNNPTYGSDAVFTASDTWQPKNGYWHYWELCATLNSSASGSGFTQGNGTVTLSIDGTTYVTASNINMRGNSTTAKINNISMMRMLYGNGVPSWRPRVFYDQWRYSTTGTPIGVPVGANRGSQDTVSPYVNIVANHGFVEQKLSGDCTVTGSDDKYVSTGAALNYRDSKSYSTSITHGGYVVDTATCGAVTEKSLKSETTTNGHGAGLSYPLPEPMSYTRMHLHSWVYLPSGNSFASIVPLSGFIRYGSNDWTYKYAFYRTSGGKFGLHFDNGSATAQITSSVDFPTNQWNEVEIYATQGNKCAGYINGTWAIPEQDCSQTVGTWLWDYLSAGPQQAVLGIIGDSPATTFTVYNDDADILSASAIDCTGWGVDCPHASGPAGALGGTRVSRRFLQ